MGARAASIGPTAIDRQRRTEQGRGRRGKEVRAAAGWWNPRSSGALASIDQKKFQKIIVFTEKADDLAVAKGQNTWSCRGKLGNQMM
jgi:hypothetical protein